MKRTHEHAWVTEKVKCCNSHHTVVLTHKWRLSLLDHGGDEDAVEALRILNPHFRCRCTEVLWWWEWITTSRQLHSIHGVCVNASDDLPNWVREDLTYTAVLRKGTAYQTEEVRQSDLTYKFALRQLPKGLRPHAELKHKMHWRRGANPPEWIHRRVDWEFAERHLPGVRNSTVDRDYHQEITWQDEEAELKTGFRLAYGEINNYQEWTRRHSDTSVYWSNQPLFRAAAIDLFNQRVKRQVGVEKDANHKDVQLWRRNVAGHPFASLGEGDNTMVIDAPPGLIPKGDGPVSVPVRVLRSNVRQGSSATAGIQWALANRMGGVWRLLPLDHDWPTASVVDRWL